MRLEDTHERELVRKLLEGDEDAFDRWVDEYYPRLFRFAFSRLNSDRDLTQDVVQGTFEKIIPRLASFRGEAALFTWMCGFCRFEIAAHWRQQGRRMQDLDLVEDSPQVRAALESLAAHQQGPDDEVQRQQLARLVWTTLDHLPVHYGNALQWKYIAGLTVREIAERLDLSPKAAESVLTRARQAFRDGFASVIGGMAS